MSIILNITDLDATSPIYCQVCAPGVLSPHTLGLICRNSEASLRFELVSMLADMFWALKESQKTQRAVFTFLDILLPGLYGLFPVDGAPHVCPHQVSLM